MTELPLNAADLNATRPPEFTAAEIDLLLQNLNAYTQEEQVEILSIVEELEARQRAEAACNTINELEQHGLEVPPPSEIEKDVAATLLNSYAENAEKTSKAVTNSRISSMTPASLVQTHEILQEFGQLIATRAAEIRNTVVNKLILETENPDARIRIQALVNLGKMTDIGLFTDRKEITITHQNADELREKLREKLNRS